MAVQTSLVYRLLALSSVLVYANAHAHLEARSLSLPAIRARQLTRSKFLRQATKRQTGSGSTTSPLPGDTDDDDWLDDYTYDEAELPVVFVEKPAFDDSETVVPPAPVDVPPIPDTRPEDDGTTMPDLPVTPPAPVCMIDPADSAQEFSLIDVGQNLLIAKNSHFGRMVDSDFAESTEEYIENYQPPTFYFSKPASGPDGFYDIAMVTEGSGVQYLARTSAGEVILVSVSSEGHNPVDVNGVDVVTTLFSITCEGYISASSTLTSPATSYIWDTDSTYGTLLEGEASREGSIFTVPARSPPSSTPDQRKRAKRLLSSYSSGSAPRCRSWPPRLWANVRPGARGLNPNGCGSGATSQWIPQFNFGGCCNDHDNCFDNCENGSFEGCNDVFTNCMVSGICGQIAWYHPIDKVNCKIAGYFYGWVVSTWLGQLAFYSANTDRCQCNCPDNKGYCSYVDNCLDLRTDSGNCGGCARSCSGLYGSHTHCENWGCACDAGWGWCGGGACTPLNTQQNCGGCGRSCPDDMHCEGSGDCVCNANIWGNDDNNCGACRRKCANGHSCQGGTCVCTADIMNDSNHCGGCGNVCPRGTKCGGGQCVCAKDQCGNLCLDFQTHPRNCGACGTVCPSGICHNGACYTPDPSEPVDPNVCVKKDAIVNGGFDNGTIGYGWDPVTVTGTTNIGYGFDAGATSAPNSANIGIYNGYVELDQQMTLCPSTEYAFTFNVRKVGGTPGAYCWIASVIAGQNTGAKVLNPDGAMESVGPFWVSVGEKPAWGGGWGWEPITFSDDGKFAYAQIGIGMSCDGANAWSYFRIDDVSVYPV
ncbi:hypothetical protein EXIGLDRAFT_732982 [Exidia glandulosa HHB12029]|uniref:SRCR domain-containing protein n=1 Tax=Exidia glandulosa HHB12029 TaxID=1314781 RepID=A0A165KLT2_EXIGL|nr:hypothetical protein EXIGLDRAFT_732982 [Exidia glandulosa HHB12029]